MFVSSKSTTYIKARCFFINDKIKEGEAEIRYCPTKKMWNDVLNNPKQGDPFRNDQAIIMNTHEKYKENVEYCSTHPDLLSSEGKENLEHMGVTRPQSSSSSALKDIGNQNKLLGVPVSNVCARKNKNTVSWSNIVYGNL